MSKWKTLTGEPIKDIVQFVSASTQHGQIVHVGTDSLQTGRYTQFVTVIVILSPRTDGVGHGGRVFYTREVVPRIPQLRERLMKEVWKSVELAMKLPNNDLTVHIDANSDAKHMSSKYLQELVGLVVGCGFKALWKPDSWAATHCADHVVRTKGKLPRNGVQPALKAGVA
jgi:predicted RNase H-related nuclease YkuK (DUF458 family)